MNSKLRINNQVAIALCGGLMAGVSVPVIIASFSEGFPLFIGMIMLVSSLSLVGINLTSLTMLKKGLLAIHGLIGATMFVGIAIYNPHTFLICWSILVMFLAGIGWFGLRNEQSI